MSIRFAVAFALAGTMVAAPAWAAQQPSHDDNQAQASAKPAKAKKVCRREQATGSIMVKRTCHTSEEWAAIDQANGAAAQDLLDHGQQTSGAMGLMK